MDRRQKVVAIVQQIEAAKGKLAKKKEERDAADRKEDAEKLSPDDYRKEHGRCPNGYEYDPFEDTCLPTEDGPQPKGEEPEPEPEDKDDKEDESKDEKPEEPKPEGEPEKFKPADTPEERKQQRQQRRQKLQKLFAQNPKAYAKEVKRMRESGELPDRKTSELLSQIDDVDSLPEEILNDKEKLQEVIEQQDTQRYHEELVLKKTERALQDFERERQRALDKGKRPPRLEPFKLLQDMERQYGRKLPGDTERMEKILEEEADDFAAMVSDSAQNPGSPSYWWKKWFEKVTAPLPVWTPGGRKQPKASVVAVLDDVAAELQSRGAMHVSVAVDAASERLLTTAVRRPTATTAKTMTSPGVTNMEPTELGFPPYDKQRPVPKHVPNEPSGRLAFPPYDAVETVEYRDRDAKMQGFPPYDGKGEIGDSETVGLPPYNKKKPHMGRGFPPYHDGKSVYKHRREAVDEAVK